jgi:hypothetical protein
MDLAQLGRSITTPLGFIAILCALMWASASFRAWKLGYAQGRMQGYLWMFGYSLSLAIAYLTPLDRDTLRLYIGLLIGWNAYIAFTLNIEMREPIRQDGPSEDDHLPPV